MKGALGPLLRFKRLRRTSNAGFTLIEIMIVLAIMVGVLSIAGSRLFSSASAMRSNIRKLATMTREVRNNSRMYNVTTRLVFDLKNPDQPSYWVESAPGIAPLLSEEQKQELDRLTSAQREGEKPKVSFTDDSRVMKGHARLARGLFIENIEFAGRKESVSTGMIYIHFFPQGLGEEAVIHFTDRKSLNWTVAINPLTGHANVYERKISLRELKRE